MRSVVKLPEPRMLLSALNWSRVAIFACTLLSASFGVARDSAAQDEIRIADNNGFDSMVIDPAPTPAATIQLDRSDDESVSDIEPNQSRANDLTPALQLDNAVAEKKRPTEKTLVDPKEIEWTNIPVDTKKSKILGPDVKSDRIEKNRQPSSELQPADPAGVQYHAAPLADTAEFTGSHRLNTSGLNSNSLLSSSYHSYSRPRRPILDWLRGRRTIEFVDPNDVWADYDQCDAFECMGYSPYGEWNRLATESTRYRVEHSLGRDVIKGALGDQSDLNHEETFQTGDSGQFVDSKPDTPTGISNREDFDPIATIRDLPPLSDTSFEKSAFDKVSRDRLEWDVSSKQQVLAKPAVVVHPPLVQPYRKNQYTFVVENPGSEAVQNINVQLAVTTTAKIFGALPSNSLISDQAALFHVDIIPAGGYVELHVGAVSIDERPIEFQSSVSVTSTKDFAIEQSNSAMFRQVGAPAYDARSLTERETPPVTTELRIALPGGSQVVRNPFFGISKSDWDETASAQRPATRQTLANETGQFSDQAIFNQSESNSSVVLHFSD